MNQHQLPQTNVRTLRNLAASSLAATLLLALVPALTAQTAAPAPTLQTLRQNFLNPPNVARPMVRWWWFGPAVVKPEILNELQQMKADGIQGAEIAFEYPEVLDDPAKGLKNLPFLSPEMLDCVKYAQEEGRKLGLRIDITLGSGWPYGGENTPLSEATGALHTITADVPAGGTSAEVPAGPAGRPTMTEDDVIVSAVIADPAAAAAAPAGGFGRGGRGGGGGGGGARPTFDAASAKPATVSGKKATFPAADHARIAVFFISGHSLQQVKRASVGAEGYVLDSFSHKSVADYLAKTGEPLIKAFGTTPPTAIFSDSLEAYGSDWTRTLPEDFKKRWGYDLVPHLPELVAGGTPEADNIRHDYGRLLTELINQNYLKQMADWAAAHHTKFRSQTYGEPAVSFSSQNIPQLAEGEGPQWRSFSTLRWATSANHVFNHEVTSGETFTWLHSPVFRAIPLDMKTEADIDFIMGENQIICHGWPYSPPDSEVPEPGWSLYAAAVFNNHNPWHPVMPAVTGYIGRLSWLLRQGKPANQVAILLPTDDVWAGFHPGADTVTGAMGPRISPLMSPILSAGYNADFIDADAINSAGLGTHQVLVLPSSNRIPLATLRKIAAYVAAGGKVIAIGHAPSMDDEGKTVAELTSLSNKLFDPAKGTLIPSEAALPDALNKAARPDFQLATDDSVARTQLGFIRRKLPTADVYFVANTSNQPIDTTISFATSHKFGELWDPDSTAVEPATATSFPLHLAAYESRVLVFSDVKSTAKPAPTGRTQPLDLSTAWKLSFPGIHKTQDEPNLTDWTADPSTAHYSGEGVYSHDIDLQTLPPNATYLEIGGGKALPGAPNAPPDHGPQPGVMGADGLPNPLITRTGPGMHAYYDPPVHEAALVVVNGQAAGALWHPPYRLDVTKFLKVGKNHIEIHVFNTAINAWSGLPPRNYGALIDKYGDRFQMQDICQQGSDWARSCVSSLKPLPSGLLGDVRLVTVSK